MANSLDIQTILDGPRNAVVKVTGVLDTSNQASVKIYDPATLMIPPGSLAPAPLARLNYIDYSISDQLEVQLSWGLAGGAGAGKILMPLAGRGRMNFDDWKGIPNDQANSDGTIWLVTTGWTSSTQIFTVILEMIKSGIVNVGVK